MYHAFVTTHYLDLYEVEAPIGSYKLEPDAGNAKLVVYVLAYNNGNSAPEKTPMRMVSVA